MMKKSGELLQNTLIPFLKGTFDNYQEEHQNSEYESFSFSINQYSFRNRLAKKTPTKKGYFVVFWEKDNNTKMQSKYKKLWGNELYDKIMLLHKADMEAH